MMDGSTPTLRSPRARELESLGLDPAAFEARPSDRFAVPYRFPYHLGLFLAVNAIPGAFLVIDGPDCVYRKAEWIHGKHDLCSTLLDAGGRHRIVSTLMHSGEVIKSAGEEVVKRLRRVGQLAEAELILVNTMPHVQIIGTQYDALIAEVAPGLSQDVFEVPSRALEGDWLDGYAAVLETLAAGLEPPVGAPEVPRADAVAIIGNLMDRTEADHTANVAELERLVAGLGLDPVSTWLSGRPVDHLRRAFEAGVLLALPHGVEAARILARRTGARVVEIEQPFGFGATIRALATLAEVSGRESQAQELIDAELRLLAPRFEWLIPSALVGRRVAFSGDPTLFGPFVEATRELGIEPLHLSAPARKPAHGAELDAGLGPRPPTVFAPARVGLARQLGAVADARGLDLLVGGSETPKPAPREAEVPAQLGFGFPNFYRHALHDSPFLGFRGWAHFVQEMANLLAARR